MRREIKRHGEGSPRAERAKADYDTWIHENGKQRGPAPHPKPDLLNQTRTAHDAHTETASDT
jgi:hypothetical protein